jgi:hypothetical protein
MDRPQEPGRSSLSMIILDIILDGSLGLMMAANYNITHALAIFITITMLTVVVIILTLLIILVLILYVIIAVFEV